MAQYYKPYPDTKPKKVECLYVVFKDCGGSEHYDLCQWDGFDWEGIDYAPDGYIEVQFFQGWGAN